ncbi:hypothetical protein F4808DRAFT_126733 [Astrocystis sublimbata]|nr:hypothetical protein F4808DRAFT_126733 [Astrocystis sublimbata]
MCGDESSQRQSFGGALVVLSSLPSTPGEETSCWPQCGRLVFHNPETGGSLATHATPLDIDVADLKAAQNPLQSCLMKIHQTGDLSTPATESPLWTTVGLKALESSGSDTMMYELERPVKLDVGDGMIGRRVSIWTRQGEELLSEGIAGHN